MWPKNGDIDAEEKIRILVFEGVSMELTRKENAERIGVNYNTYCSSLYFNDLAKYHSSKKTTASNKTLSKEFFVEEIEPDEVSYKEYLDEMMLLKGDERPPCCDCDSKTWTFCNIYRFECFEFKDYYKRDCDE